MVLPSECRRWRACGDRPGPLPTRSVRWPQERLGSRTSQPVGCRDRAGRAGRLGGRAAWTARHPDVVVRARQMFPEGKLDQRTRDGSAKEQCSPKLHRCPGDVSNPHAHARSPVSQTRMDRNLNSRIAALSIGVKGFAATGGRRNDRRDEDHPNAVRRERRESGPSWTNGPPR